MRKVGVFVYGDIGRSPRMQNHAIQLSNQYMVYLMGYVQTEPKSMVTQNSNIKLVDLQINNLQVIRKNNFTNITNTLFTYLEIQIVIVCTCSSSFINIKNPPSIPNLFAIWLASKIRKFKVFIDFHNYGFTILKLNVKNKYLLKIAEFYQKYFSKKADGFFCVSNQMKKDLQNNWNINAVTLYDLPLNSNIPKFDKTSLLKKYNIKKYSDNQILMISSTSWTKDQDFSILLDVLQKYQQQKGEKPFIHTLITGKGPEKQKYQEIIKSKQWKKICIETVWLDADDYPRLLSVCDIGVCLHYSSSGLDLPMKVVDMFGACIPVLAINFSALPQLVQNGQNGYIFKDRKQLQQIIIRISKNREQLKNLKQGVKKWSKKNWHSQWRQKAKILF